MGAHRAIDVGEPLPVIALANRVEYVGGPRDSQAEDRADLPEAVPADGGMYQRSVRCAEDGAMRYVWRESTGADPERRP